MAYYMQFGNIKGDVSVKGYEGWIELHSIDFAAGRVGTNPTETSEREIGEPVAFPFKVTKSLDSASPGFFEQVNSGFGTDICLIHMVKDNKLKIEFKLINAVVSNFQFSAVAGSTSHEFIEINYTAFEMIQTTEDGSVKSAGYDFAAGKVL